MITSKITSVTYENGKRIELVENTYSPSDDMMKLGQLQNMLGQMMARMEQLTPQSENAEAEIARLNMDISNYKELITLQQGYVDSYTKE